MKKFRIKSLPKAQEGVTTQDSLDIYNNALELKAFYDQYKPYYSDIKVIPFTETYDGYTMDMTQAEHLTSPHITSANKAKIKSESNPNIYHISDMVTPLMDPKAPLARFDKRIKPQGYIEYIPKTYFDKVSAPTYKLMEYLTVNEPAFSFFDLADYPFDKKNNPEAAKKTRSMLETYAKKVGVPANTVDDIIWRYSQNKKVKTALPGYQTTIPYYDPIMVKPWHMLTEKEKEYRKANKEIPPKPKGTTDPKESVVVNLIKSGLAKDTASAKKVRAELMEQVFGEKATGSAAQNTKLNKWLFDNPDAMTAYKETGNISITKPEPIVNTFPEAAPSLPLKPVQPIITETSSVVQPSNVPVRKPITNRKHHWNPLWEVDPSTGRFRGSQPESEATFRYRFQDGGSIELELTPEEIQWYLDNGYNVEEVSDYQDGGDVISSYGWDYKKEGDKYFTRKTGTEDWITPQGEALQAIKQKIYNEVPYTAQDRRSEYLTNLQNLVAQGYGIDDLVKMGMGTKAGLTSILGSTEYVGPTPVKQTKVAETPVTKNSYWDPARYGNKFAITGMQNPKFALDMSSVNNFKLSKTPENVVHAKELRRTGKQLTPQEQAAFDINYNPNQSIQNKLIYRQGDQPYREPEVYTAHEVIPTTYHWNPIFNTYSDTMGELFNPDTSFEVSDSLTKSSLPLANEIEGYNILKQKIKNELASNKPELKIEKIFRNKEQGEELLERQHLDNIYYGQFMNRGNAVANRTGIGRHRDSNILISDIVEKNPNTVVIDIGSGLGNDNPELAGVSLTELPKNVFAKAKVIGTDIPESYERFKMHQKEKQYPFDSYRVPLNFNTPVKDIIDKKAKNSKTVVLRAANSIDLLMNPEEAQKHLEHILKQTFGKEVYYLFNKHVLYKDSKSNSFKIIGQINNAGFDHINNSWETNLDRKPYELFEKEFLR